MFGTMAFVLTAAVADPDLVTLRYETSLTAWSMCIDHQLEKIGGAACRRGRASDRPGVDCDGSVPRIRARLQKNAA